MSDQKTGIFQDSNEDYHSQSHIGASSLKKMAISPGHFLEAWRGPKVESAAFDEGNVVHSVLLEQSLEGFVRRPDGVDGRTKEGKATLTDLAATGKTVLTASVFDSLERRLTTFAGSNEAMRLYDHAEIETSHYAKDPVTGLYIKARPDILRHGLICDLKTVAFMPGFEKQIWNLGYYIQLGFYALVVEITQGNPIRDLVFIAQEKSAPYGIQTFKLERATVEFAKEKARELLNRASVCISENNFPIYDDCMKTLGIPPWVISNEFSFEEAI